MSSKEVIVSNAIIESASIGYDRDVFLGAWLTLDYGGCGQGFGGYVLGANDPTIPCGRHADQPNLAAEFIVGCLRAADVDSWDKLKGKTIRVRHEEYGRIFAIGHITKNDRWFNPEERFKAMSRPTPAAQGDGG